MTDPPCVSVAPWTAIIFAILIRECGMKNIDTVSVKCPS